MKVSISYDDQAETLLEHSGTRSCFQLTPPDGACTLHLHTAIQIVDIHGVWCSWQPSLGAEPASVLPWKFDFECGAHKNAPIVCFMNLSGRSRCTLALTDLWDDMHFHLEINQETCTYELDIQIVLDAETKPFDVYVGTSDSTLQEQLASWRTLLALPPMRENAAAWDPVFCTWYAVHGAVDQQWVEANMPAAVKLGFKTLIVDDGWSYPEKKRVSPQTIDHWYEHVADWWISGEKFPSFEEHVRKIQALGMKYMVWVAPHLIGENSRFLAENPDCVLPGNPVEGHYQLDVRNKKATKKMLAGLRELMTRYHLDGYKIDFIDIVEPSVKSPCGRATYDFICSLGDMIRSVKPDALMEYRQSYVTPATLGCATQFRAADAPFDFALNFSRIIQVRLLLGDGVPVHADPAYWNPLESDVNIARHLIAMLAGVPMLSVELTTLPERHGKIISFWMDFYRRHQHCLNHGHWDIKLVPGRIVYAAVSDGNENIVILRDARQFPDVPDEGKSTYVLNLSDEAIRVPGLISCWAPDGTGLDALEIPLGGGGIVKKIANQP